MKLADLMKSSFSNRERQLDQIKRQQMLEGFTNPAQKAMRDVIEAQQLRLGTPAADFVNNSLLDSTISSRTKDILGLHSLRDVAASSRRKLIDQMKPLNNNLMGIIDHAQKAMQDVIEAQQLRLGISARDFVNNSLKETLDLREKVMGVGGLKNLADKSLGIIDPAQKAIGDVIKLQQNCLGISANEALLDSPFNKAMGELAKESISSYRPMADEIYNHRIEYNKFKTSSLPSLPSITESFVSDLQSRLEIKKAEAEKSNKTFLFTGISPDGAKFFIDQVKVVSKFFIEITGRGFDGEPYQFETTPSNAKIFIELIINDNEIAPDTEEFIN